MPEHVRKKLEQEIQDLERELNFELPKELKKAVAMGDLSENAEYHMARQRQEFVRARLGQLKKRMAELALVNLKNIPRDRIAFGSRVVVFDQSKNAEIEYRLVTSEEANVEQGLISTTSPIGRSLIGKKVGETTVVVTPNGRRELEVLRLSTIHDEAS
jgi:transcription elongation factor GreA